MDVIIKKPEIGLVSTIGASLWQNDDGTHIKPKGSNLVYLEYIDTRGKYFSTEDYTTEEKAALADVVETATAEKAKWGSRAVAFYVDGTLAVDTSLMEIIIPFAMTIKEIRLAVATAPTGANLIIDINQNGTTLYTTQGNRPTIVAGETSATATDPDITSLAIGDKLSIDINQVGSTVAGEKLSVTIICEV